MDKLSEQVGLLIETLALVHDVSDEWKELPGKVAQLEVGNEKLNEELREMVLLEERRQFLLGEVLRKKRKALEAGGE